MSRRYNQVPDRLVQPVILTLLHIFACSEKMKANYKFIISVVLGSFFLMADAFYNGFPIVYSDTSTYIASGFEMETPFDRPITYGIFIRIFSLNGLSLWGVIFFQGLILSYLILLLMKIIFKNLSFLKFGLFSIMILSLFSGVSWTVSQIMPDIFTSISLLCFIIILHSNSLDRKTILFLYILFFISVAMHMSHVLFFVVLILLMFVSGKFIFHRNIYFGWYSKLFTLLLLTVASLTTMGSAISKSKHVFFFGAMVEHGIVKTYLDDCCKFKSYKLCIYKDSLPDKAYKFIWDEKSPFYKIGGWKNTKQEFKDIIYETLTRPKYIALHIKESFKATILQLFLFSIGDGNGSFLEGTLLYERISKYFLKDLEIYSSSKQNQSSLSIVRYFNILFYGVVFLEFIFYYCILH
ncbi:MAG: hypothetical protein KatS3mg028_0221 [Bacteroidia bacterium]|nr:MAG: hypothetical protein KatS3mg028_0221 [Bacteroidia bacterium]